MAIRCSVNRRAAATLALPAGHYHGSSNTRSSTSTRPSSTSSWWDTSISEVNGKAPLSDARKASLQKKWMAWLKSAGYDPSSSSSSSTLSTPTSKAFFDSQTYDDSSITRPSTARTSFKTRTITPPLLQSLNTHQDVPSTSSLDPLVDYEKHGLIPRSPLRLYQLVTFAYRAKKESIIYDVLHKIRHNPLYGEVEVQALFAVLDLPVDTGRHTHQVRAARREGRTIEENKISQDLFFSAWTRLWDLHGESLSFDPSQAAHILQTLLHILSTTSTPSIRSEEAVSAKTLRHLVFLAGLDENPILALDLLTYILYPHFLALSTFKPLDKSSLPPASKTQKDDIPLILHDILRSGIIPSSVIKEFDLSSIIGRGSLLSSEKFSRLLKQTLLRMVIRTYTNRKRLDRATSCLKLLEDMDDDGRGMTISTPSIMQLQKDQQRERDVNLLRDVCKSALQASETSGQWVNRISEILSNALLFTASTSSGLKQIWDLPSSLLARNEADLHLLRLFFDTALPPSPPVVHHSRIRYTAAMMVWKALHSALGPGKIDEVVRLSMDQAVRILAFTSRTYSEENMARFANYFSSSSPSPKIQQDEESTQRHDFIRMIRYIRERIFFTPQQCTTKQANDILSILLTSTPISGDIKAQQNKVKAIIQLYETFISPNMRLAGQPFYLQRRNLVPLVQAVNSLSDTSSLGTDSNGAKNTLTRRKQADSIIHRFIQDRSDDYQKSHRLARDDLTTITRAFLANGDRNSAFGVLSRMIQDAQIPSLGDVEAIIEDMLSSDPETGLQVLENCLQAGLKIDRRSWRNFADALGGQVEKNWKEILQDLRMKYAQMKPRNISRQPARRRSQGESASRIDAPPPYPYHRARARALTHRISPKDTASASHSRSPQKQHVEA